MLNRLTSALLVLTALLLAVSPLEARAQDRTKEGTAELRANGTVRVDNHEGQITIETWDRNEVKYRGVVKPEPNADHPEATTVTIDRRSDRFVLRTEYDESKEGDTDWWGNGKNVMPVEYHLTVPRAARVEIDDHESEIHMTGLRGAASIDTHDGTITLSGGGGDVEIDAHNGPIRVNNHRADLRIDTHDSDITLQSVRGGVEIDAHDSEIEATELRGGLRVDAHEGRGRFDFAALTDRVEIETHDGTVTITVPSGAGFDLSTDFDDDDAELRTDFDRSIYRVSEDEDDDVNYAGPVNGGGPRLVLTTHDGSFEIRTE